MPIRFKRLAVGPIETNCYIIQDESTLDAAIIDPGAAIEIPPEIQGRVKFVLLTHGHGDHCFFAGNIANNFNVPVLVHESDAEHIKEGLKMVEMLYDLSSFVQFSPSKLLKDGDVLHLGESSIEVIHTPGHTPGGVSYATDAGIFCGDTIFAGSIGRTDLGGGSYEQIIESILCKLMTLEDSTVLHPGHGPSTTVGRERATNPFLA